VEDFLGMKAKAPLPKSPLRSLKETCALLGGVSLITVQRLIDEGEIRATHVAARVFVADDEIARVIREGAGARKRRSPYTTSAELGGRENVE
jgi:hypothetical protein